MAKKVLSFALALLMMFNVFAVAVSAAGDEATITLSVDNANPQAGDTVKVTVSLQSTYKVFALQMMLAYDNTFYEVVGDATGLLSGNGAEFSSVVNSATLVNAAKEDGINVDANLGLLRIGYSWLPSQGATNAVAFDADTAIATFNLKVKAGASGSGEIKVAPEFIPAGTTPAFDARLATYVGKGTTTIVDSLTNGKLYGNAIVANNTECVLSTVCLHENVTTLAAKPATCTESGLTAGQKCNDCGATIVAQTVVPATGHTAGEWKVTTAATATTDGLKTLYCSVCNAVMDTEVIPATGHTPAAPVKEKVIAATCYSEGSYEEVVYCSCCTPKVEISRTKVTVEKTAHTEVTIAAKEATCTSTGLTEGKKCSVCNTTIVAQTVVDKLAHTAGTPVREEGKAPTATENGYHYMVTKCTVCGTEMNRETVEDEATGHTPAAPVKEKVKAATCYSEGSYEEVVYCSCCTPKVEISRTTVTVEKLPHTEAEIPGIEATCTSTGLTAGKECLVCYEITVEQEVIEKLPHNSDAVVTDPTCTEKGFTTYTCKDCKAVEVKDYVDALGHTEEILPAVDATCVDTGLTEGKKCTVCGATTVEQTVVDALGHKAGEATEENRIEATFETAGSYDLVVRCTVCGEVLESNTVVIPAGKDGPADYTELDKVIAEAEDIDRSIYTDDSLKAVDAVLAEIEKGLTAEYQDVVDGWVEELRAAIDALEEDTTKAEAKVTTVISKNKVKADDIVTVTVKLTTNFYVTNLQIPVLFDKTQFEIVGKASNKTYLTMSDMFASRNYTLGGRADQQKGFDATSNPTLWDTEATKAQYGVAYITLAYDAGIGSDDETYARPQDDVFVTFQLKAIADVEDTTESVFVSTDWAKTADNKKGYLVAGMTQTEEYDASVANIDYTRVSYETETIAIAGVTVSGTVKSFNDNIDNSDDVTISFYAEGSDEVLYTTTVTGSGTLEYSLDEVVAGTYTVTVAKANHVTRTYEVVVGEENVAQDLVIHLKGDINGDGRVNAPDVALVNAHAKGTKALTGYQYDCANINGDAKVNAPDVALVNAHAKGTKSLWS